MWWDSLTNLEQIMFIIATAATALMIIFIILMLIGMDGAESFDGGVDVDFDGSVDMDDISGAHETDAFNDDSFFSIGGLKLLTFRGVLVFFSIGGWVVFILAEKMQPWLAIVLGLVAGVVASILYALAMKAIMNLESSGNLDYSTAIGKIAEVYIRVPKDGTGKGKVTFNHQGRLVEVDAITKDNEDLLRKQEVKIIKLVDETTLVVEKYKEE